MRTQNAMATAPNEPESVANKIYQLSEDYTFSNQESRANLKEQLGELLLFLQAPLSHHQQGKCLKVFEEKLRRYIDFGTCGVLQ